MFEIREYPNGDKYWYLNGKRHREGGPAVESAKGTKLWYLNGKEVTEEEVMKKQRDKEIILLFDNSISYTILM
uniref:Uncharacterized protein n=1 Tax=viral metagenome TaxID=1070528 RepID=A0A6M3IZ61_9ZZZZ